MDGAVRQRPGESLVDAPVLVEQRQAVEGRVDDGHLEVVAAARPVLDADLDGARERLREQAAERLGGHGMMVAVGSRLHLLASLPERLVRSLAALLGGTVHETAALALPRFVRRSRLYEATAKNMLRITVELVGGVEGSSTVDPGGPEPASLAARKTAGNAVELGSIAAVGFSPLWLLAAAADVAHGSRVYLDALVAELKAAGVLTRETKVEGVDGLLGVLEGTSGGAARLIDIPPLALADLRASLDELRGGAAALPSREQLARTFAGLRAEAARERRSLLEVSSGMALAFALSARTVGRDQVGVPYREDWAPLRDEGFAAYAARVAAPYREALGRHFDPGAPTLTGRALARLPKR